MACCFESGNELPVSIKWGKFFSKWVPVSCSKTVLHVVSDLVTCTLNA